MRLTAPTTLPWIVRIAAHPELDFYVYYIEKDTDINFETGEKIPACDYLYDRLEPGRLGRFAVDSFDRFSTWFYRTDHHWNLDGSYRGYTQLLELLASHFNNTYSVDLRYYEAYMGEKFSFDQYVEEHGVNQVLLIGNIDYFIMDEFLLGGRLSVPAITLPIGISFCTFQILPYVIDLYRGKVAVQRNYFYLLLYVSFFSQLIDGPIVRYQTVEHEIRSRRETLDDAAAGMRRFIQGLAKKVVMANSIHLALAGVCIIIIISSRYNPFIYFRF